jgi:mono/diheme cytochrome c family protein
MRKPILAALAALGLSSAADAADPAAGARIAAQWCANCHVVAEGQAAGADQAPSLPAIAADPAWDDAALIRALSDPHPRMPDPGLSRAQIDDVIAWLRGLRG